MKHGRMGSGWVWALVLAIVMLVGWLPACGDSPAVADGGKDGGTDAPKIDGSVDASPDVAPSSFDVSGAQSTSATRMTVTFDAPPNPSEAVKLANYSVPGLTLSGTPTLAGSTVSITTSVQSAIQYTVTVSGVTRASDAQTLTVATADFTGRAPFDVTSAAAPNSATLTVTFDAPPNTTQATTLSNYTVSGLTLSAPQLSGNTVTLTTSPQAAQQYTVNVTGVTRASDGETLTVASANFNGVASFNVASAASTGHTQMTVTFDAPPDQTQATTLANYSVPGLTLSSPQLNGSTVTLTTTSQSATSYTVTVSGVTRASDSEVLATSTANFTGRTSFNVASAASPAAGKMTVTFDAPPSSTEATTLGHYSVPGLTLSSPVLTGSTVTFDTTAQSATTYTVTVSGVTRASDSEPLVVDNADFTGRPAFDVQSASSTNAVTMTVTFDAAPNVSQATTLANYSVSGLTLSGTPTLVGNTVTMTTSGQSATTYTVTVSGVGRANDGEPLTLASADFNGTAVQAPTVTNVVVASTNPNNGLIPYNTGTVTVTITGTDFGTVTCPAGVTLDDLDGVGTLIKTPPTSCTVDSDTQITATWPAGLRTNGSTGWNVLVTNTAGSNATSSVKLVAVAGLLISEVYTGTTSFTDHEFVELYNPTGTSIDTVALGLKMHTRSGTGTDTSKTLTAVTTAVVPSHGFVLIVSSASTSGDAWYANRDYTYSASTAALVGNGGVYISLSATDNLKVIDKAGWGTQPSGGYEGTAMTNIASNNSAERKPAGGSGHATDTDDNSSDFNAPSTTITPRGTVDAPQP